MSLETIIDGIKKFNAAREEGERLVADTLTGAIGLMGMMIPAYWASRHLHYVMSVPTGWSVAIGVTMGLLEFVILNRFFELLQFRMRYADSYTKGSVSPIVPLGALVFYFVAAFLVNGFLAFFDAIRAVDGQGLNEAIGTLVNSYTTGNSGEVVAVLVPATVRTLVVLSTSLLSIPGAIVTAVGFLHRDFVDSKTKKTTKSISSSNPRKSNRDDQPTPIDDDKDNSGFQSYLDLIQELPEIGATEAANKLGVSRTTIYTYKRKLENEQQ